MIIKVAIIFLIFGSTFMLTGNSAFVSAQNLACQSQSTSFSPPSFDLSKLKQDSSNNKTIFVNQADIDAIDNVQQEINEFSNLLDSTTTTENDIITRGQSVVTALSALASRSFFQPELDEGYTSAGRDVITAAKALKATVVRGSCAFEPGGSNLFDMSDSEFEQFINEYNDNIDNLNDAVEVLNSNVDAANEIIESDKRKQGFMILAPFIICLGVLFWLYRWSRDITVYGGVKDNLVGAKQNVFRSLILPTLGLGITSLSYVFADKLGGKFYVSWGFVLFGGVYFLRNVIDYKKLKKLSMSSFNEQSVVNTYRDESAPQENSHLDQN